MPLTYEEAVHALGNALRFGIDPSLDPITRMCAFLGNPQKRYRCVQVAGSNGKSSTTRITAALLRASGCKVGLYTSPHLVEYPERMEIDGEVVGEQAFAEAVSAALDAAEACGFEATEFELLTAAALWLFAREGVEWAVLECGLGGRWDATTVADSEVAVITGVALEHTEILGDTLEKIAAEKAAIIKRGSTAVLAHGIAARAVFEQRAADVGAQVVVAGEDDAKPFSGAMRHLPSYQYTNTATSLAAARAALGGLPSDKAVRDALRHVVVPGRFEVLRSRPLLMIDAAHNPQSAQVLAQEVDLRFGTSPSQRPVLLLGVLADKDARGVVEALASRFPRTVVTASSSPRALAAQDLADVVEQVAGERPHVCPAIPQALDLLGREHVLATGSITVAGEVKRAFSDRCQ